MKIEFNIGSQGYGIYIDGSNHTLVKENVNDATFKITESTLGFYSNVENAIKKVIHEQISNDDSVVDLNGFLEKYRELKEEIESLVKP